MPEGVSEIIGIDLGTTFSAVGIWKNGQVEIIANKEGSRITPSFVSYTPEELLVGDAAKKKQIQNLDNTVYDVKRLMGKAYDFEMPKKMGWPFSVKEGRDRRPVIHVKHKKHPITVTPEDVSAKILEKMKETIERNIGKPISKAVITVPAYFSQGQKQATINAAKIAGLEVEELITEPAAAAYAYGFHNKKYDNNNLLVFDFGGGIFDVVVMKVQNASFQVESVDGDTQLGGRDIDNLLVEHFAKQIQKDFDIDVLSEENRRIRQKLLKECTEVKHTLSSDTQADLYLGDVLSDIDDSLSIDVDEFNTLCNEIFERVMSITRNAIIEAKMKPANINKVLLIGGSSRIPKLQELLAEMFGKNKLDCSMHPDEAVAYGAAVRAAQKCSVTSFDSPNITLVEATPLSLGTSMSQGRFCVVIPRNTSIPCRKTTSLHTICNDQKSINYKIYEGERPLYEHNNKLGEFDIGNLTPGPAGSAKTLLTFELNKNGILKVTSTHKDEKAELKINYIQNKSPQKSIEDLLADAKLFKEQDERVYEAMRAKSTVSHLLEVTKYKLSHGNLSQEKKSKLQPAIKDAETWLRNATSKDKTVYEKKKEELDKLFNDSE